MVTAVKTSNLLRDSMFYAMLLFSVRGNVGLLMAHCLGFLGFLLCSASLDMDIMAQTYMVFLTKFLKLNIL
jgi:hypothetical protein